jgi:hypothetical protein
VHPRERNGRNPSEGLLVVVVVHPQPEPAIACARRGRIERQQDLCEIDIASATAISERRSTTSVRPFATPKKRWVCRRSYSAAARAEAAA